MKVNRTKEGTIFELICGLLILVMWIVAFALYKNSPDTVPTHFDIAGNVDATGDKIVLLVMAVVGTVVTATVLLAAYKPDKAINIPFTVSNTAQDGRLQRHRSAPKSGCYTQYGQALCVCQSHTDVSRRRNLHTDG